MKSIYDFQTNIKNQRSLNTVVDSVSCIRYYFRGIICWYERVCVQKVREKSVNSIIFLWECIFISL